MLELTRRDRPMIVDVGAHVGLAASRFRELFPGAILQCFEPYPGSFESLRAAAGGLHPIELHGMALGSGSGQAEFSFNRNSAANSLLASDERAEVYWRADTPQAIGRLTVPVSTLDAFVRERSIEQVDILKIDVQGGEYEVLEGARGLLEAGAIGLVYMELITVPTYVGQHRIREYLELFDAVEYELFDVYNFGRSGGRLLQTDIIVVSPATLEAHENRLRAANN